MVGCSLCASGGGRGSLEGRRSGLELLPLLFLGLKMPLNLVPGEAERRLELWGGSRPVLLRPIRNSLESVESERLAGKVDDLDALLLES